MLQVGFVNIPKIIWEWFLPLRKPLEVFSVLRSAEPDEDYPVPSPDSTHSSPETVWELQGLFPDPGQGGAEPDSLGEEEQSSVCSSKPVLAAQRQCAGKKPSLNLQGKVRAFLSFHSPCFAGLELLILSSTQTQNWSHRPVPPYSSVAPWEPPAFN